MITGRKKNRDRMLMNRLSFIFLFTIATDPVLSESEADLLAKGRIIVLENQGFIIQQKIKCFKMHTQVEKRQICFDNIPNEYPERFATPDSIEIFMQALDKPTPELIEERCGGLSRDNGPNSFGTCSVEIRSEYFQNLALIKQGINPESYRNPDIRQSVSPALTRKIKLLEDRNFKYGDFLGGYIRMQWVGARCDAKAQKNPFQHRPTCDSRVDLNSPDGHQFCRLIEWDDYTAKEARVDQPKYNLFPEDADIPREKRKIKGLYTKLHAAGGGWSDQYKSSAQLRSAVLDFLPYDAPISVRKQFNCEVLSPVIEEEPIPEDDIPYMDISISIRPGTASEHSGTVSIQVNGNPPWEVTYTVEALRIKDNVSTWHTVGKESVKFTKSPIIYNKDWYWHEAMSWRLTNVTK
jgi:hypothetical protein